MEIIQGPLAPLTAGNVVYQVTLASGMIVTSPSAFGAIDQDLVLRKIVVTQDGRVLISPSQKDDEGHSLD